MKEKKIYIINFLYFMFSASLLLWTLSGFNDPLPNKLDYIIAVGILDLITVILMHFRRKKGIHFEPVTIALIYLQLGLSVAHRSTTPVRYTFYVMVILVSFILGYAAIHLNLYKSKIVNVILAFSLPFVMLLARITGSKTNGSYLYVGPVMIFTILFGYIFVSSFLLTQDENKYVGGNIKYISANLLSFLLYNFLLYFCCLLCNELGVLLIIGISSSFLLLKKSKSTITKICYCLASLSGSMIVMFLIPHVRSRVFVWLNPSAAYGTKEAESILYVFRHIKEVGVWGMGLGTLYKRYIPTLTNDHSILLLSNDYSIYIAICTLILSVAFVFYLSSYSSSCSEYEQILHQSCTLIFGTVFLLNISSNIGSFLTSGIGFPFISLGFSTNITFALLLAVHCSLNNMKGRTINDSK